MQAATMTRDMVMAAPSISAPSEQTRESFRRWTRIAFLVIGVAATAYILGLYGTILVYGLPAPFIRRVPIAAAA